MGTQSLHSAVVVVAIVAASSAPTRSMRDGDKENVRSVKLNCLIILLLICVGTLRSSSSSMILHLYIGYRKGM